MQSDKMRIGNTIVLGYSGRGLSQHGKALGSTPRTRKEKKSRSATVLGRRTYAPLGADYRDTTVQRVLY